MAQKLISVFAATALFIGVAAADGQDKKTTAEIFKSLDRDADQRLSKSEVARDKVLTDRFAAVDADSDGYLTQREYSAHMKEMRKDSPKEDY